VLRLLRNSLRNTAASKLERLQPDNGGFLEATPLTSFVLMNLTAIGEAETCTARRAAEFLRKSVRDDGSWPIDTNLSTWVSTWAVNSLQAQQYPFSYEHRTSLKEWLLNQQYQVQHPYTNAAPGGWAWTDLPGGVPDADDTPGALLALLALGTVDAQTRFAGELGTRWLLDLQNRDGGIPTFCKGWGALPFDRSGCDLTAHVLRAWVAWLPHLDEGLRSEVHQAIPKALAYLIREQRADGTWVPLWFGHQDEPDEQNVLWGTARVVLALRNLRNNGLAIATEMLTRGTAAIVSMQQPDGGWAGGFDFTRGKFCPCLLHRAD
jgi:squalene-hopene/tetraprenyl-beta-curcumene cyclase